MKWDGHWLTVRDIQKMAPDIIAGWAEWEGVLYVKTRENPWKPVPLGWHVSRETDGVARITEQEPE